MKKFYLFLTIIGLLLAEIALKIDPRIGFLLYAVLVVSILSLIGNRKVIDTNAKVITAIMILPMVRMIEVFLPFDSFYKTFAFYLALTFLATFYVKKFEIDLGSIKNKIFWIPLVVLIAVLLGYFGRNFLGIQRHLEFMPLILLIAISEEMLFRALIQKQLKTVHGSFVGIFAASLIYFIFSLNFGLIIALFFLIVNIASGYSYDKTDNIYLCLIMNIIINILVFVV